MDITLEEQKAYDEAIEGKGNRFGTKVAGVGVALAAAACYANPACAAV